MKIEEFNKLEKEIKKQDFNNSYFRINKVLFFLSILGNIGSVFLGFFFMSRLITESVTEISSPTVIASISLILLGSLELIKREVLDKFSLEFIRAKYRLNKEVSLLVVFSLIVVLFSAYAAISGAQEFSSKNEVLVEELKEGTTLYADSITTMYNNKILKLEDQNAVLFQQNLKYDEQIEALPTSYTSEKKRIREEKRVNEDLIEKNDGKIKDLKTELTKEIKAYESKVNSEITVKSEDNDSNSFIFIFISAVIEMLILIGIFFNKVYKYVSYTDYKERVSKDVNFQKWIKYSELIDIIFPPEAKINDKVPSMNTIFELSKINSINLNMTDINQCLKLFNQLKITKSSGPVRYLNKDKDQAIETLKTHFKVE